MTDRIHLDTTLRDGCQAREIARQMGDFVTADRLRDEIELMGYHVEDTPTGSELRKRLNRV